MNARVTSVETRTTDVGLIVQIEVQRIPNALRWDGPHPKASDVPVDIRGALSVWLEGEQP